MTVPRVRGPCDFCGAGLELMAKGAVLLSALGNQRSKPLQGRIWLMSEFQVYNQGSCPPKVGVGTFPGEAKC